MRDTLYFSKLRVFLAGWRWRLQRFRPSQWRRWQRTHRTICSPRSASLFTLEPLESRLLLAADLTGVVQSSAQIDPAVPGNAASAVVQVQNIGNQRANATTQVGVYASLDATLGAGDVLLGSASPARSGSCRRRSAGLRASRGSRCWRRCPCGSAWPGCRPRTGSSHRPRAPRRARSYRCDRGRPAGAAPRRPPEPHCRHCAPAARSR